MFPVNTSLFRVDFNPALLDQVIKSHGKRMLWAKGTFCSNTIPSDPDRHKADCTICDGNGIVYSQEKEIRAVAQSIALENVFRAEGRFDLGTMTVTTPSNVDIGPWDRLKMVLSIVRERHNLIRNSVNDTDRPKFDILDVFRVAADGTNIVYQRNVDFKVTNGQIQWLSGKGPAIGTNYSLDYTFHPVYIVVEMSNEFRDALTKNYPNASEERFNQLPKRALCKRDFQVRQESLDIRR
jgi:hypothetical protein